jgi:small subunit ribosomal protein S7
MPRRRKVEQKIHRPDAHYGNVNITKFINKIMLDGKKRVAEKIVYDALEILSKKVNQDPVEAFSEAIKNVTPLMEVKSRRVGGSTYQVPVEVKQKRGLALAIRWLINNSRNRSGKAMSQKLAAEFVDAFNKTGASIKKREDTHKMAEANKAFAHFRW